MRIGQLSRELERSKGGSNPRVTLPVDGKSKEQALAEAGTNLMSLRPDLQKHIGFDGDLSTERPVVAGDQ